MTALFSRNCAALLLASMAASSFAASTEAPKADNQPAPMVLLVPVEISDPGMKAGCWAQLYDERNFKGEMFTILGPMQLDSTDKSGARQVRKNLDSLMTGPKATLTLYQHKMFKDKSVQFGPNSKEAGLIKRLGFTGRIESMKLDCSGT